MFLYGTVRLAISLNVIRVVAMVLDNLVRPADLVREFANPVDFSRALDLNMMDLDDISNFKVWLSFGIVDKVANLEWLDILCRYLKSSD